MIYCFSFSVLATYASFKETNFFYKFANKIIKKNFKNLELNKKKVFWLVVRKIEIEAKLPPPQRLYC
jgi:hypothetical protein